MPQQNIKSISDFILSKKSPDKPLLVGINGIDGSGKTSIARNITEYLSDIGKSVATVSIDDFHNPREKRYAKGSDSPEGYYYDSMNFDAFKTKLLEPIKKALEFPIKIHSKIFDLHSDKPQSIEISISEDSIVIVEGVFLFKPDMIDFFDIKVFIDVEREVITERMIARDLPSDATSLEIENYRTRIEQKYMAGQDIYLSKSDAKNKADIVIDNNDYKNPIIV
jgi:uridine kinase